MKPIKISIVKSIREDLGATHLILFAIGEDGVQHVATHGDTEKNAKEAARAGNRLKELLNWEAHLCKDKPLKRVCANCTFFERLSKDGYMGNCMVEPTKGQVEETQKCRYFEPKC